MNTYEIPKKITIKPPANVVSLNSAVANYYKAKNEILIDGKSEELANILCEHATKLEKSIEQNLLKAQQELANLNCQIQKVYNQLKQSVQKFFESQSKENKLQLKIRSRLNGHNITHWLDVHVAEAIAINLFEKEMGAAGYKVTRLGLQNCFYDAEIRGYENDDYILVVDIN
jgi:polyribonucleotide nucleotidyltransferase